MVFEVVNSNPVQVCDFLLVTVWWFSLGIPVSSTNKTDRHNITEILLKVALNTINQINTTSSSGEGVFDTTLCDKVCQ
jgi:hypothetical protein